MPEPREGAVAMPLNNGRIIIIGGYDERQLKSTLIYDHKTASFSEGPDMNLPRWSPATVKLDDDNILVIGGADTHFAVDAYSSTEILNTSTMAFSAGPSMATRRFGPAAVKLTDGRVLVLGGSCYVGGRLVEYRTTEFLDITTNTFSPGPSMQEGRKFAAALQVDDQRVLVIGGESKAAVISGSTEVLDLPTGVFSPGPALLFHCPFANVACL